MISGNKSVLSHQKFFVSISVLLILLLTSILYSDFSRPANAGAETSKSTVAAARLSKNAKGGCCGEDEGNTKPHLLAGSYYTINNNFSAKLLLNNKGPLPIEVRPTLFSMSGERFEAAPVTVDANSHRFEGFLLTGRLSQVNNSVRAAFSSSITARIWCSVRRSI